EARYAVLLVRVRKCGRLYTDTLRVWVTPSVQIAIVSPASVCRDAAFCAPLSPFLTSGTASWNMGAGTFYNSLNRIAHAYTLLSNGPTQMNISVTVNDPNGCPAPATATKTITVLPSPVAHLTPGGPFLICDTIHGLPIPLTATMQSGFG